MIRILPRGVPLPFLVVLAFGIGATFVSASAWRGDLMFTLDRAAASTMLTGPLLAGATVWLVARAVRCDSLSANLARRRWAVVSVALLAWALAALGLLAQSVLMIGWTVAVPHGGAFQWWGLLSPLGYLAMSASIGLAFAMISRSLLSVVSAVVTTFLLPLLGIVGILPELFRPAAATGSLAGMRWSTAYVISEALGCAAIAVAIVLVVRMRRGAGPRMISIGAGAAVLIAIGAGALRQDLGEGVYVRTDESATACIGSQPKICVAPSFSRHLSAIDASVRPLLVRMTAAGFALPNSYRQSVANRRIAGPDGVLIINAKQGGAPSIDSEAAPGWVVTPADCDVLYRAVPSEAYGRDQGMVIRWLSTGTPSSGLTTEARNAFARLRACKY